MSHPGKAPFPIQSGAPVPSGFPFYLVSCLFSHSCPVSCADFLFNYQSCEPTTRLVPSPK